MGQYYAAYSLVIKHINPVRYLLFSTIYFQVLFFELPVFLQKFNEAHDDITKKERNLCYHYSIFFYKTYLLFVVILMERLTLINNIIDILYKKIRKKDIKKFELEKGGFEWKECRWHNQIVQ